MSFPRYEKYKDSGVEWLGEVPAHWCVKPNKALLTHVQIPIGERWADTQLLSLTLQGVIHRDIDSGRGKYPADFGTYQEVLPGDLVFCLFDIDETPRTVGLSQSRGMITSAYDVFRCKPVSESRYLLYYYLHIDSFKGLRPFYTGLRKVVRPPTFMAIQIALPPQEEQAAIAAFLDHETAKIDALVEEQKRLIELLKEKRQAVISHAVTKGMNPNAPMKDSGVEWLGEVPAHWSVERLKFLATRIGSGKTPLGGSETYQDDGVLFIRSQNVYDDGLRLDDVVYIDAAVDQSMASSRINSGDILLNITGASIGRTCIVPQAFPPANVNQHVCIVRIPDEEQATYVAWLLKSDGIKQEIDYVQDGAAREGLNYQQIGSLSVPLPPVLERVAVCSFLSQEAAKLDVLVFNAEAAVSLLQERRTALISAAVTGKIDVRAKVEQAEAAVA